jgi:hypothetical protein
MGNPWTPAPWHATTSGNYVMAGYAAGGYPIARMDDLEAPHSLREGNARLVAAAPEMAEALEQAERHMVGFYRAMSPAGNIGDENAFANNDPVILNIRTLLSRIRGETP